MIKYSYDHNREKEANVRIAFSKIRGNGERLSSGRGCMVRSDAAGTIAVVFAALLFACKAVFDKGTAVFG